MDYYNINITQGSLLNISIVVKDDSGNPIDLTGYTISGGMKMLFGDSFLLEEFNCLCPAPTNGTINILLSADETSLLPITEALYGIEAHKDDSVIKILQGYMKVYPEIIK